MGRSFSKRVFWLLTWIAVFIAAPLLFAQEAIPTEQPVLRSPFVWADVRVWLYDHGLKLLLIVLGAFVLLWLVRVLSARVVAFLIQSGGRGTKVERENRAHTLVSVFQNTVNVAVYVAVILMVLNETGISIGPLLAGAGVVGLAVAFGAQSLVKDYFYGFMILLENQYGVNDVVKIGDIAGQVERITLRITMLRDQEGTAHFIPHGTISAVSNLTHLWSRAVFDIGVSYKEDVDRVMEVLLELGRELRQDPQFSAVILEDPQMLGVEALADSAVVLKFTIKTQPLKQWDVKRALLRRIKRRFEQDGIEIPFPHRTLYHRFERDGQPLPIEQQSEQ